MSSPSTRQKRRRVEQHLLDRIEDGPLFVKSKFLAEDLALSTREIGAALGRLGEESARLDVQQWAYTSATTWRIEERR
jgi:hypothetical protein